MRQRRGVARILQLPQRLGVGQYPPRIAAGMLEQPPLQGRLFLVGKQQHIARDGGLDQAVGHIAPPALWLAEQHDLERTFGVRILVPQVFDCLRPARNFLDLVQHQHCAVGIVQGQPRCLPLLRDSVHIAQRRLIRAGITHR